MAEIDMSAHISAQPKETTTPEQSAHPVRMVARYALAGLLVLAGVGHLSWARSSFRAQVPGWVPGSIDSIVLISGLVEIGLGATLIGVRSKWTGWIVGAFFVAVFPGNISQYINHRSAFGLNTDAQRGVRLLFQPVLVAWAVWSTDKLPAQRSF